MKMGLLLSILILCSSLSIDYCSDSEGADPACNNVPPGTDFSGKACNSTCQLTNESFEIKTEFRTCLTENLTDCIKQEPITDLHLDYRVPLLVTFDIPLTPGLQRNPPIVNVSVDDKLEKSQESDSGYILFRYISPGEHNFTITVSHPDYVDAVVSEKIFVRPGLSGDIFVRLVPKEVIVRTGDPSKFNLTINNSLSSPQNFTITSNLNATFPSSVIVSSGGVETFPVLVSPFDKKGSYTLNLTVSSTEILLNAVSSIIVGEGDLYNATLTVSPADVGLKVIATNTGSMWDDYNLTLCDWNTTLTLEPGTSRSYLLGPIDAYCDICIASQHLSKCMKLTSLSLKGELPIVIEAELGKEVMFPFKTISNGDGMITVHVDNPWIDDFKCNATCNKMIRFTPNLLGDFVVNFQVSFPDAGIEGTLSTQLKVVKGFLLSGDKMEISKKISDVETQLLLLESKGVSSPATEDILSSARNAGLETPEEVAEVLGQLDRAEKYIKYAKDVELPRERGIPLTQIVAGFSAILLGVGIIYIFNHYKSNPYHPVYQRFGLSPKTQKPGKAEEFIKNEFKGSQLPPLR